MTLAANFQPFERLALVGMDASWAGCDGLDAFERLIYEGSQPARVEGGIGTASAAACGSLLSIVAKRAILDGLDEDGSSGQREISSLFVDKEQLHIAALIACGQPVQVNWPWATLVIDLSSQPNPLASAIEQAQQLLANGSVDQVVFAACAGLSGLPENLPLDSDGSTAPGFDREVHGWRLGEGAGAVVWMRESQALREGRHIYAVLSGAAFVLAKDPAAGLLPAAPVLEDAKNCIRLALEQAGVMPEQVGYVEAFASGVDALDGIEIAGLVQSYRQPAQDLTTALGSGQAATGYLGDAAGLAGLVRAALCLDQRMLPGAPGWTAPKLPALWRGAPFYVPNESRAWFPTAGAPRRVAALNVLGRGGSFAHLVLAEATHQFAQPNQALACGGFFLFPLAGDSLDALTAELTDLQQSLTFATNLNDLATECYQNAQHEADATYALSIVGHDAEEIRREIDLALKAIPAAFEKHSEWQTPLGSCFTPDPAGRQGGVALVYPGAFNSYPGVGKDLFRLFPALHQSMGEIANDIGQAMRERLLYPRSLTAISKEEMAALEAKLLADPIAMLISGTALAILYTHILRDAFKLRPAAAFGYSLGENSMLYATGVWRQGDAASARLENSEAFRLRLAGPQLAVREYWGLPAEGGESPLWSNYLVMAAPEKVLPALGKELNTEPASVHSDLVRERTDPVRVYLTHINTPRQVVIGGDPQGCRRLLTELRASSIQAPFDYALHCQVMRSEFDALAELHSWPVESDPALKLYTASDYGSLPLEQPAISQKIAHMLTSPLDFPRLVRQVYADGARVFIEAGAGSNCARWVDESLKGSPHLALSLNRRGSDDYSTLIRTLARLYSHHVPLDLSVLYQPALQKVSL